MTITNPTERPRRAIRPAGFGPHISFAGAAAACFAAWGAAAATLQPALVMPLVASLMLGFAALFAVIAWHRGPTDAEEATYWDVVGGLTLVGLCATATIDPDQLVRAMFGTNTER